MLGNILYRRLNLSTRQMRSYALSQELIHEFVQKDIPPKRSLTCLQDCNIFKYFADELHDSSKVTHTSIMQIDFLVRPSRVDREFSQTFIRYGVFPGTNTMTERSCFSAHQGNEALIVLFSRREAFFACVLKARHVPCAKLPSRDPDRFFATIPSSGSLLILRMSHR